MPIFRITHCRLLCFALAYFFAVSGEIFASSNPQSCAKAYAKILWIDQEEQELVAATKGNLYKIPPQDSAETLRRNEKILTGLDEAEPAVATLAKRKLAFSPAEVEELFQRIKANPRVVESLCLSYRGSQKFGFCFGRAFAAHLEALRSGLDRQSIKKAWMVGPLQFSGEKWNYHVATIVKAKDGQWFAIDPLFQKPLPLKDWHDRLRGDFDPSGTSRLYVTAPSRLFPYDEQTYRPQQLNRALFKGFFTDLLESMKNEAAK